MRRQFIVFNNGFIALAVLAALAIFGHPGAQIASAAEETSAKGYVDVHMHLDGSYMEGGPGSGRPARDYESAADHLIEMMNRAGVEKAIVMPPPQGPKQRGGYTYQELLGAVQKYPGRLVLAAGGGELSPLIFGSDPKSVSPKLKEEFEQKAQGIIADGAKAFGEMAALHFSFGPQHPFKETAPDHPLFLLLADIAAQHNLAIDLHMEAVPEDQSLPRNLAGRSSANPATIRANLPAFERLLAHNRKARIVWQHIGWDNTGYLTPELLRRLLNAHSNLYLAIKVVRNEFEPFRAGNDLVDPDLRLKPEWKKLMSDFSDRFVVGADEFVGIPDKTRRKGPPSFEDTWTVLAQLPADLRLKIGRSNALRIYNLK